MEEIRIGVLGNVDSGKSTLISVLKNKILDNGRGSARSTIFKHKHEQDTGRTSSLSHHFLEDNNKLISFIDLAGHEKYLKTTIFGLNACSLDYVMLLVGSNMGILKMTKEHLGLALALKIPIITVVTKVDICPEPILKQNMDLLAKILSQPYIGKKIIHIEDNNTLETVDYNKFMPVIKVSNTKGLNIDLLRNNILKLRSTKNWSTLREEKKLIVVEDKFNVPGIGVVVSGVVNSGVINIGDKLKMGPFRGMYVDIIVKSIHDNFRNPITKLSAGYSGCFNIKCLDKKFVFRKSVFKKGVVMIDNNKIFNRSYREFLANITILHHPTTIRLNYEPIIHCGSISQSAKIFFMDSELLRTGDNANIKFRFKNHPEFIEKNSKLIFREGRTKGIGYIKEVY